MLMGQWSLVFLFAAMGTWFMVVAEHQQAQHDKVNQESIGYVID